MPVYEVIISGLAVGDDGDSYLEIGGEDYIDYDGSEDELAADILSSFKDKGIRLVRTPEMKLNDTDRIKVRNVGEVVKSTPEVEKPSIFSRIASFLRHPLRTLRSRREHATEMNVNIRSEGIGTGIKTTTISDMMDKMMVNYEANKKTRTRKAGSHHPTGAGSTKIRKERAKLSKEYFKGEKK
jgi:hypothetical protein